MRKPKDQRKQLQLPISQIEKLENEAAKVHSYIEGESILPLIQPIEIDFGGEHPILSKKIQ